MKKCDDNSQVGVPIMEYITSDDYIKLMRGSKKPRKRTGSTQTAAESKAGEYLTITRNCQGDGKNGGSVLLYEPFKVCMGTVTYKPDWVVFRSPFDREIFEVKEVRTGASGQTKWAGFRAREAQVKLELLRRVSEEFGWRVFLLLVEGNSIKEREIV